MKQNSNFGSLIENSSETFDASFGAVSSSFSFDLTGSRRSRISNVQPTLYIDYNRLNLGSINK